MFNLVLWTSSNKCLPKKTEKDSDSVAYNLHFMSYKDFSVPWGVNHFQEKKKTGWHHLWVIGHFTVVCLVTWPWIASEAGGDLVLIQTLLLFICKCELVSIRTAWSTYEKQWGLYQNKVTPASLPIQGQVTKHTVKWPIVSFSQNSSPTQRNGSFYYNCRSILLVKGLETRELTNQRNFPTFSLERKKEEFLWRYILGSTRYLIDILWKWYKI